MLMRYPVDMKKDRGTVMALFPDVPEAMTVGKNIDNALLWAQDALIVALGAYIAEHRDIPMPSRPKKGRGTVPLPLKVAMKLAIYQAMRDQGVLQRELGRALGISDRQVRRILDLDHNTVLEHLEQALMHLGKLPVIDVLDADRCRTLTV